MVKTNNEYLKTSAKKVGSNATGVHTDNFWLKEIASHIGSGGEGGSVDLSEIEDAISSLESAVATLQSAGFLTSLDSAVVDMEQLQVADAGMVSSYQLKQGGVAVGSKINIPLDYLLKNAHIRTVSVANEPMQGFSVGEKYFDFEMNTESNDGTTKHLYLSAEELRNTATISMVVTLSDGTVNTYRLFGELVSSVAPNSGGGD